MEQYTIVAFMERGEDGDEISRAVIVPSSRRNVIEKALIDYHTNAMNIWRAYHSTNMTQVELDKTNADIWNEKMILREVCLKESINCDVIELAQSMVGFE